MVIDPSSGVVTSVGPVLTTLDDNDLAAFGGVLWVSDSHYQGGTASYTNLLALNPNSGAILCSIRVTYSGDDVFSEGLTVLGSLADPVTLDTRLEG